MKISLAIGCIAAVGLLAAQTASPQASSVPVQVADASAERALLNQYCVTCHNQKLKTAGLMLDKADVDHVGDGAEVWEKVIRKIHGRTMPPLGMPRPDQATLDGFASSLEVALDRAAASRPEPGRAGMHRLNRA